MKTPRLAAGLESKLQVDISEVVGRNSEVAGASLARFGGFFAERTRAHDFLLGYRNMLIWMCNNLERADVDAAPAMAAARTRATTIPGWIGGRSGRQCSPGLRVACPGARRRRARASGRPQSAGGPAVTTPSCAGRSRHGRGGRRRRLGAAGAPPRRPLPDAATRSARGPASASSSPTTTSSSARSPSPSSAPPTCATDERARLLREVRVTAQLCSHPNILTVHDAGEQGEFTYVVLELVEGGSVAGRLAARPERAAARARAADRARRHRGARVRPRRTASSIATSSRATCC